MVGMAAVPLTKVRVPVPSSVTAAAAEGAQTIAAVKIARKAIAAPLSSFLIMNLPGAHELHGLIE